MISQTYAFRQNPDTVPGESFGDERVGGAMAVPMRCHRAMIPADIVVSPPVSVLGAMVMALLALPREVMMAGTVMAQARPRTRRGRGV